MPQTPTAEADTELAFAGLDVQARMLVNGEVSSRELVELSQRRIAASQPTPAGPVGSDGPGV